MMPSLPEGAMISFWMRRLRGVEEEVEEEGDRGDDGEDDGCFGGEDVT
eukprot:CAMPEP_0183723652 /NCGR_PEP_ID=MMETSP0737-20130205/16079_1 /TAXON_ID=385413 /ORGANISM="Thalassiosira miniscula, Strain CCMP1093" /LENGTH=47 /DNA_ID= /DNA_START= /DNA_END= /DNA_ORIENTATION=